MIGQAPKSAIVHETAGKDGGQVLYFPWPCFSRQKQVNNAFEPCMVCSPNPGPDLRGSVLRLSEAFEQRGE